MNIFFNSHSEMSKVYCKIAHFIEKYDDINVDKYYFLAESKVWIDYIKKNAPQNKSEIIYIYKDYDINKLDSKVDFEKLKIYEKKYGITNLWLYVTADRIYRRFDEKKILKALNWHIEYYEDLFKNCKNDIFISADLAGIYGGFMDQIAKAKGVITIKILPSSLPKSSRVFVSDNLYFIPNGIEEKYKELLNRDLSIDELRKAREVADFYRNKRAIPVSLARC